MRKPATGLLLMLLSGAAIAAPAPVKDLNNGTLEERVARIERMLAARQQVQIELQQQTEELQNEVSELRGTLELHNHKLEQILSRQRDLYQELDRRLGAVPAGTTPASTTQPAVAGTLDETQAYQQAIDLILKEKKYTEGAQAFAQFIQDYPESSNISNAHYWLGQLKFSANDLTTAKASFALVVDTYLQSPKRADAIFKLGLIAERNQDAATATKRFRQVVEEYPKSSAARLAKQKL